MPAIDIMGGKAVQLVRGDPSTAKDFGDPVEAARKFAEAGATWLHVVDLDAAFDTGDNAAVIADLVASTKVSIQLSGGLRDDAAVERALGTGCARISIGTAALERPEWCRGMLARLGQVVAISLDVAGEALVSHGWREASGNLNDTMAAMADAGCRRFIVTDTRSDGTLAGPNLELLGAVCAHTGMPVIASGGISTLEHIRQLRGLTAIGIEGAIIGTALYLGHIDLRAALEVAG